MKTNFSMLFYVKRPKNQQKRIVPVYVRITVSGKRSETTTGVNCDLDRWNPKTGRQIGNKEEVKIFNAYLDNLQSEIYKAHKNLSESSEEITAESIRCKWLGIEKEVHTVMDAMKLHNQKMEALIGNGYAIGTLKRFQVLERHVQAFLEKEYRTKDMNIKKINRPFITDFEFFLRTENRCSANTAAKYLKNFGKILRITLASGWIDRDPMFGYKIKMKPVERPFLTDDELNSLARKKFSTERLSQVRDIFLFCCLTGLAYSDVEKLSLSNIQIGIDGSNWIYTNRTKTGVRSAVPLLASAVVILDRYKDNAYCTNKGRVLPVSSNQKMNEYLKEIAILCGIEKHLSSHIARHTFATTVTLLNGVPIESVSKMLGHTNIKTTQIYAKILDIKVSADMALLKEKFSILQ
ncbi:site-specific integrase [Pedobacter endophyticus]|uniref:Site-specific integrase n=1 Tax=Pedobacter endophyticus TaxID=2789740 RepID=A0A7U3Q4S8_9SPHI|nr:site-specific integrase [Pedobacter endophyticus]QPH38590.1 site-specific integrase [Pedobacter endophyticus]